MNTRIFTSTAALCAALAGSNVHGALTVEQFGGAVTADTLVHSLIGTSTGIGSVSNAQFVGNIVQAGSFTGGAGAGLGFDSGIVLSSGKVSDLPLKPGAFGAEAELNRPGDSRLEALVGDLTRDAAVLKFDFVPSGSTIQLTYVFGSSEYNEWVLSEFNDTFAAFVNGINAAVIPGTHSLVQINNLNCGQSTNIAIGSGPNCSLFGDNWNTDATLGKNLAINLGGFSKNLSFAANVNPGVANSMYLVIGDVRDMREDSAVFLAAATSAAVPEPGTLQFLGVAAAMLVVGARRRLHA